MFDIHYTDCPEPPLTPPEPDEPDGGYWRDGEWIEPWRAGEEA